MLGDIKFCEASHTYCHTKTALRFFNTQWYENWTLFDKCNNVW